LLSVRFVKTNKLIKTSIILFLIDCLYIPPMFMKFKNPTLQRELVDDTNIIKADFSIWIEGTIVNNIHCIIALSLLGLSILFFLGGILLHNYRKKKTTIK